MRAAVFLLFVSLRTPYSSPLAVEGEVFGTPPGKEVGSQGEYISLFVSTLVGGSMH